MKRVIIEPRARDDVREISAFIGINNPIAAMHFFEAVHDACDKLLLMPGMGSPRRFTKPSLTDVRSWPIRGFEKYLIFYRPVLTGIEVIRVVHGMRDLGPLLNDR